MVNIFQFRFNDEWVSAALGKIGLSLSSLYKNNTLNGDINDRFGKQLRYTRNPIHQARFLLEQGSLLLKKPNQNIQEVGQVLLGRLLETFKVVL